MTYPTERELLSMGARLQRDICLWNANLAREYSSVARPHVFTRAQPDPLPEAEKPPTRVHRQSWAGRRKTST